jgi:malate/lactate dehydrogenase
MSLEGWRLRRGSARGALRPPRAVISGDGLLAREVARRLAACTPATLTEDAATVADVVVICDGGEPSPALRQRVRDVSLRAARACPLTALVIAASEAMPLCVEAMRASGLPPWLIVAPGGMTLAASIASRLSSALGLDARQIQVPVIGGEAAGAHAGLRVIDRGVRVAGVPWREYGGAAAPSDDACSSPPPPSTGALAAAAAGLTRAILTDSRRVLCCTAWVEEGFGLPGGFVTVPVPVGARGAESPLPLRLTLDERALLQRVAAR